MIDDLVIIAPELRTGAGGVGDYTLRLIEHLPSSDNLRLLVPHASLSDAVRRPHVDELGTNRLAVLEQLPKSGGKLLVQYSAYGFDRFGCPRDLIRALIDWKNKERGRLVVMFHEIWTFWPMTNKNFFVQLLHRRAIKRLLECTDVVFTTTPSQAEHLGALSSGTPIHFLPVGSTIRLNDQVGDARRMPGWAIIFGLQHSRIRALKKIQNSLSSLAAAGQITKIFSVGVNSDPEISDEERRLLARFGLREGFEQLGPRSEREVSRLLQTVSFGIFGQDELSYGKSSTFTAYAAHGLSILADFADSSKLEPICWLIAPRELLEGISQTELRARAKRLRVWQQQTSSWQLIGAKFAEALELNARDNPHVQTASR